VDSGGGNSSSISSHGVTDRKHSAMFLVRYIMAADSNYLPPATGLERVCTLCRCDRGQVFWLRLPPALCARVGLAVKIFNAYQQ